MSSWANFTLSKQIESNVNGVDVLQVPWRIIVFIDLRSSKKDKLLVWNPFFLDSDNLLPDAPKNMYEHKHHEYEIDHFITSFRLLSPV